MTKHTPEPWVVDSQQYGGVNSVRSRFTDRIVASCKPWSWFDKFDENAIAEAEANARLIAAAPDMLEFLKVLHADGWFLDLALQDKAVEVIAKAEGE